MKLSKKGTAALVACLGLCLSQSSHAQQQYQTANVAAEVAGASLASYNTFDDCGCDDCNTGGCSCGACNSGCGNDCCCGSCGGGGFDLGAGLLGRPGQFFIAADYLYVRSTFSESTAFVTRTQFNNGTVVNQFTEIDYDYESSYRVFGGYRFCDCGGEIQFAFTRLSSGGTAGMAGADQNNLPLNVASIQKIAAGELVALDPNTRIDVDSNVDINSYDLGYSKTIPLGSPMGCGCDCGDSCCDCDDTCCDCGDCCGCGWCPAWDIKWSAGVRFAEVDWDRNATAPTTTPTLPTRGNFTRLEFEGAGPRWGLEGRRYIGKQGRFSVFTKGDISLLLGDVSIRSTVDSDINDPNSADQIAIFDSTQIIPVLDIVVGGTVYLGRHLTLSGGYLFSAWHDLGMRDTFPLLEQDTGLTFDDANILGFDGYFARAEAAF